MKPLLLKKKPMNNEVMLEIELLKEKINSLEDLQLMIMREMQEYSMDKELDRYLHLEYT